MKLHWRPLAIATLFTTAAIAWSDQNDTGPLFPNTEFQAGVYGESANGNVIYQHQTFVGHSTTTVTTHTTVAVTPPPPPPPPPPTAIPNRAVAKAAAGTITVDPTVTRTVKHTYHFRRTHIEHNVGGGGYQFDYFFNRYCGILVDNAYLAGSVTQTVLTGNLAFRYPIEYGGGTTTSGYSKDGKATVTQNASVWGFAPYAIIGGGEQWGGGSEGIADVGAGVEFRFRRHYGVFVESRWIIHDHNQNYAATTAGFSYSF